ncbi:hypothetical protein AVEN_241057-1 [Araneus ventricosus]|uniref:Uncharacterized protein n=1 Tax=Araneus ventricosus TaxID=182803 RepID=A0A4Y2LDC0_ARAVE|nr:hypothetical protein AVEN_241057-1 [Araneus ventricosus]
MTFGPTNPIHTPYGQFVYNYTHPRKPLCSAAFGHIALWSRQLNVMTNVTTKRGNRCEVNHVFLRKHGMHFLPRIPIQLSGNPLGSELGVYSVVNVNVSSPQVATKRDEQII